MCAVLVGVDVRAGVGATLAAPVGEIGSAIAIELDGDAGIDASADALELLAAARAEELAVVEATNEADAALELALAAFELGMSPLLRISQTKTDTHTRPTAAISSRRRDRERRSLRAGAATPT
jgi:uncharacterized protein YqfA (UPF0365 family)